MSRSYSLSFQWEIVIDVVESLRNEDESEKKIIGQLLDPHCQDWPWDLAWEVLDLAIRCTANFHSERPVMEEVRLHVEGCHSKMSLFLIP